MASKTFLLLGLLLAVFLLISSEVAAKDLAETSSDKEQLDAETNELDQYGRYPGGGRGGGGRGGYPGGGRGGYPGGGRGGNPGGGRGGYPGGGRGGNPGGGRGGYPRGQCPYGCCARGGYHRGGYCDYCCSYAGEKAQATP
ncbi:hypothetical protein HS088_TW10G00394 [Tripterygium wilfordii]|uniref:Glycine-rich protein n=1 Tax=Tripterygium wilfordii TaxID=458696 RepID=A0A7J7D4W1_TRIWF|nr:glycine-rich cell wall structural protein-like [Tripterygium wilfordii]KAF5741397.1 hypothetical protein HS088_TW10G00394 [Tripterygium wilfordii]